MKENPTVRLLSSVDAGLLHRRKSLEAKLAKAKEYLAANKLTIKPLIGLKKDKDVSV